ncbi:MAG: cytochrome C oxidase subunit IV family protein [Armatimonadota bacterium]|nr:cytochrome C oxidase subunit IV family protein [Armatimonadota bacterium]MDR5703538.1 cytochrome C oxidase subunit IV family protein [Armatimonadota bacterium]MDR7433544.1 cytochrome C oxidase subunit IV family protein [Armatimonadota bacterium]
MEGAGHGGYKIYILTWFWLLVITALEVSITLVHMPKMLMASLLILLALMKVALIAAYFMHLRFERLSLVYVAVTPLVFAAILFFALVPDATRLPGLR